MPDPALAADESRARTETLELISSALSRLKDAEQRILDLQLDLHNTRERYGAEVKVLERRIATGERARETLNAAHKRAAERAAAAEARAARAAMILERTRMLLRGALRPDTPELTETAEPVALAAE